MFSTALMAWASSAYAGGWSARTISTNNLWDVAFPTNDRGWAVGAGGAILTSSDSGQTWSAQTSPTESNLYGIDFVDLTHGWAVGANDTVVRTSDGGATWSAATTGAGAALVDVHFVDANNGWAVGSKLALVNTITHTSDGGQTWVEQYAPNGIGLVCVSFVDQQHGFVGGYEDIAYRTEDGGQTWLPMAIETNGGNGDSFYAIRRINISNGLAGGFKGNIYRTTDGGLTWTVVASLGKPVRALSVSGTSAFAIGDGGLVARSEDSGQSWEVEAAGTAADLKGIAAPDAGSAFAVGSGGTLVQFKSSPAIPLALNLDPLPESCDAFDVVWKHAAASTEITAATGDADGDGHEDIVLAGPEGLRALHPFFPTDQATIWSLPVAIRFQQVRFAELDGTSATKEVVAATAASGISRSGVLAVKGATGEVLWSRQTPGGARIIRVVDLNGDGVDDVLATGDANSLSWLNGRDGSDLYAPRGLSAQATDIAIGDLNGDGRPDVVVTQTDGTAIACDGTNGNLLWSYHANGSSGHGLRVAVVRDLDGDGVAEVVVGGEGTPASPILGNGRCSGVTIGSAKGTLVAVLNGHDGSIRWDYAETGNDVCDAISLGDLNGDGVLDVVALGDGFGEGHLVSFDGRGRVVGGVATSDAQTLWQLSTTHGSNAFQGVNTPDGISIGDGNGDGIPDVYVGLDNGYIIAASGVVPSAGGSATCAPAATQLWEVSGTNFVYHTSFVKIDNQSYLLALMDGGSRLVLRDPVTGNVVWLFDTGDAAILASGDLNGDGIPDLAVADSSGRVYGLTNGGAALSLTDNFLPSGIVTVMTTTIPGSGSAMVAAASDGTIRAINPQTGQQIWQTQLASAVRKLAQANEFIAAGKIDGTVSFVDPTDGSVQWQSPGSAQINAMVALPGMSILVAGDDNGDVRFINTSTRNETTFSTGARINGIVAADLLGNATTQLIIAAGQSIFALRSDSSFIWSYNASLATYEGFSGVAAIAFNGTGTRTVVALTSEGNAFAVDGGSGNFLWKIDNQLPFSFYNLAGGIVALDTLGDGKEKAVIATQSPYYPLAGGMVQVIGGDGNVLNSCALSKNPSSLVTGDFAGSGQREIAIAMQEGDVYLLRSALIPNPVSLVGVVSRKTHGSAGTFDVDLPLTGTPGIEPRSGGASENYTLVFTFANPLTNVDSASLTTGSGSVSSSNVDPNDAHNYIVNLTGVTNAQTITISLTNVNDSAGNFSASVPVSMAVLVGDTTGNRTVNSSDIAQTQSQSGQPVTSANFRQDVTANGSINSSDIALVQSKSGTALP